MSTEIVPTNGHQAMTLGDTMTLAETFARSGFFNDTREAAQAVVKIMAGRELGFGPMASMTGVYVVKGKVCLSANLMAAAVQRSGRFDYRVLELDDDHCVIEFTDHGQPCGRSAFSMADAQRAGLINETWRKFGRNLLFARAMSNGTRWYCAGVFGGPIYTPEELGAVVDGETGEVIDATPRPTVIASARDLPAVAPNGQEPATDATPDASGQHAPPQPAPVANTAADAEHYGPLIAAATSLDDVRAILRDVAKLPDGHHKSGAIRLGLVRMYALAEYPADVDKADKVRKAALVKLTSKDRVAVDAAQRDATDRTTADDDPGDGDVMSVGEEMGEQMAAQYDA
jgi:hypothetical protein